MRRVPACVDRPRWGAIVTLVVAAALTMTSAISVSVGTVPMTRPLGGSERAGWLSFDQTPRSPSYTESTPVASSIPLASEPIATAFDWQDGDLYVLEASNNLTVLAGVNGSSLTSIALPSSVPLSVPTSETFDQPNDSVYVAGYAREQCTGCGGPWTVAINTTIDQISAENTSLQGIDVPDFLNCVGADPASGLVYACDGPVGKLFLYAGATDRIIESVQVGSLPSSVVVDPSNGQVYVANFGSDNVTVLQSASNRVVGSIPVGMEPDAILFDKTTDFLYVANNASNNVTVINGTSNTIVRSVSVGCNPDALGYDGASRTVYVANSCSDNLTAISDATNTVVGAVPVGSHPVAIAYDNASNRLYVANAYSDDLTVLIPNRPPTTYAYGVMFEESGLPSGTDWSVAVNGTTHHSNSTSTSFTEANGTYPYSITDVPRGYRTSPSSGYLTVNGTSVTILVRFNSAVSTPIWEWIVVGVLVAATIASVGVFVFVRRKGGGRAST